MQIHTGELTRALDGHGVQQVVGTTGAPGEPAASGDLLVGVPRPRLLFLGRLHPQKGVDVLVRAAIGALRGCRVQRVHDARSARHAAALTAAFRSADLDGSRS